MWVLASKTSPPKKAVTIFLYPLPFLSINCSVLLLLLLVSFLFCLPILCAIYLMVFFPADSSSMILLWMSFFPQACPVHISFLYFISLIISVLGYRCISSSLWYFLLAPVLEPIQGLTILRSIFRLNTVSLVSSFYLFIRVSDLVTPLSYIVRI